MMSAVPPESFPDPDAVERALARLPFLDREILLLKGRDNLSYAQIGTVLGLTPEAAESRLAAALVKLRDLLESESRRSRWLDRLWLRR